jgi:hypothetical protein
MRDELMVSPKSRLVAQLLAFFLGVFGAHRFYAGRTQSAIFMLFTLGGLGLWYVYDNIMIVAGSFRDADGLLVSDWEPESERRVGPGTTDAIFDELEHLRNDVSDLQARLDFAERLLADPDQARNSR